MVDYLKFEHSEYGLILEDGIFVILGMKDGKPWRDIATFYHYSFDLYIRNKEKGLIKMGKISDEESLETILNLIEYGKFLPNNILQ